MGSDFAPDFTVPIGGGHFRPAGPLSGGWIDITDNDDLTGATTIRMDVARWEIEQTFENAPLVCSGKLGATDSRLVGYSYQFRAIVVRDINCPPDIWFRGIHGSTVVFRLGDVSEGVASTIDPLFQIQDRYYWSPDAVIDRCTTILDANGKKSNRDLVIGRFRAHVFLCPEMGDPIGHPDDYTTAAGAYNKWYNNL